jgi:chlorophyll synthase
MQSAPQTVFDATVLDEATLTLASTVANDGGSTGGLLALILAGLFVPGAILFDLYRQWQILPETSNTPKTVAPEKNTTADGSGGVRQLLGLKGATKAEKSFLNWKIRLQLCKPATWIPLIWGVACGAAASGNYHAIWNLFGDAPTTDSWGEVNTDTLKAMATMVLSGPILCGFTQTCNDWFDRDLDAINEPYRPIPSGAISAGEVYFQMIALLVAGIVGAWSLDSWAGNEFPAITVTASLGAFLAYIYSAPPLKLKAQGWQGTFALGSSYIALPWWCGHAMFNAGSFTPQEIVLTILYSIAGLGIAIVNDFKSMEGDRELGMNSLPVAFGIDRAKWICVGAIDLTQLGVAAYLASIGETTYAAILFALILPQMYSQVTFIQDPVANDVKYQAAAQPFLVFGILTTALAVGHHTF